MKTFAQPCDRPGPASIPALAGIGLRFQHHGDVFASQPTTPWFEVHPENYLGGVAKETLTRLRATYPISLHATGLSLGSAQGVDLQHLSAVVELSRSIEPGLVSDHLSWSAIDGLHLPDLLPVPYTREALATFSSNIDQVQNALNRSILIENPSVYFQFQDADFSEAEFLAALVRQTGCGVLLDVNNVAVSAANLGEDAANRLDALLSAIPSRAIGELHLAGHALEVLPDGSTVCIDDHGSRVSDAVLALYARAIATIGPRPTLIEWDTQIPAFDVLEEERAKADAILKPLRRQTTGERHDALV